VFQAIREVGKLLGASPTSSALSSDRRSVQRESWPCSISADPCGLLALRESHGRFRSPPAGSHFDERRGMETPTKSHAKRVIRKIVRIRGEICRCCRLTFCREPYPDEDHRREKMRWRADWRNLDSICRVRWLSSSADFFVCKLIEVQLPASTTNI